MEQQQNDPFEGGICVEYHGRYKMDLYRDPQDDSIILFVQHDAEDNIHLEGDWQDIDSLKVFPADHPLTLEEGRTFLFRAMQHFIKHVKQSAPKTIDYKN